MAPCFLKELFGLDIYNILEKEFKIKREYIDNTIKLIDEGNTIPFIARYRKEMTGEMSDVTLRQLNERLTYLRNLESRKEDVTRIIDEQGKLTEELKTNIAKAKTLQEVEDIYAPYKQKKRTRATIAKEKGLEPLAQSLLKQDIADINMEASNYINTEKGVENVEDALKGALDIIAEVVSDDAEIRKYIRKLAIDHGIVITQNTTDEKSVYDMYYDYSEPVRTMASHRVLAINRGIADCAGLTRQHIFDLGIREGQPGFAPHLFPNIIHAADHAEFQAVGGVSRRDGVVDAHKVYRPAAEIHKEHGRFVLQKPHFGHKGGVALGEDGNFLNRNAVLHVLEAEIHRLLASQ